MQNARVDALPEQIQRRLDWFQQMRETSPVYYDERAKCWQVFCHEHVSQVISDHAHFSQFDPLAGKLLPSDPTFDESIHRQWRGIVSQALLPHALKHLTPRITQLAQTLLDERRRRGTMDIMQDLAYPLVVNLIAEILGLPEKDHARFRQWSDVVLYFNTNRKSRPVSDNEPRVSYWATMQEMSNYFEALIAEKRRNPQHDAISEMLPGEINGKPLRDRDIIGNCMLLLVTGLETSSNFLGNAVLCFDACPDSAVRLREQPDLLPGALEEVLRFLPATWDTFRVTTSDVQVGDQIIPVNQHVRSWIVSGNRDAARFANPDTFDIERHPNPHLSFGHGIHYCFGAPLARLIASTVLPMIFEQLPHLKRAQDAPLEILDTKVVHVIKHLPVTFQAN